MKRYLLLQIMLLLSLVVKAEDVTVTNNADGSLTVTSHVVDAKTGEALAFVNVSAGPNNGTMTNYEGDFTITVDSGTVLRLTYIGYEEVRMKATDVPNKVRMKPIDNIMQEVQVRAWPALLLKVAKKANSEFNGKQRKKSQYFMRTTTSLRSRDLAEAFVEANSALNLRNITVIKGINGRITQQGLSSPIIASMNFHHALEVGPVTRNADFWKKLITPLNKNLAVGDMNLHAIYMMAQGGLMLGSSNTNSTEPQLKDIVMFYDVTGEELADESERRIYRFHLNKKEDNMASRQAILTGTLYVDAKTMRPLRFDGQVENISLMARKDLQIVSVPIEMSLHINYRHDRKFAEVSDIAIRMKSGDFSNQTLLYNVDDLKLDLKAKKKNLAGENMLESIQQAGFDMDLWRAANIIQRTREEERLAGLENQTEIIADSIPQPTTKMGRLLDRLTRFSKAIPQEKVYLHMDNTSYFLGDTIWFAAYSRQTNNAEPSRISRVLYVELYNQDGYMMERKLVEMRDGRGYGSFALNKEYYGGFYELRAYTRWQLNWGLKEHWHSTMSQGWYLNKEQERLHYRDYEKLYSRVFPVYDAPKKEGEYVENMTTRPMRRYFKKDPDKPSLELTLFPEGGTLVEGLPCHVAYEAQWEDGEEAGDGTLKMDGTQTAAKQRGTFVITPGKDTERTIRFVDRNGHEAKARLPKAEREGVALHVGQTDSTWTFDIAFTPGMQRDSLGLTIMNEGNVEYVRGLDPDGPSPDPFLTGRGVITIPRCELKEGVNQVTIFDVDGRVWADRLFFNTLPDSLSTTTSKKRDVAICLIDSTQTSEDKIKNIEEQYFKPYQQIRLGVQSEPNSIISMSVRDAAYNDHLYDNATMRTEMLLASEVRGFIPNPQWYFERDDKEHREALDLLLMIQGWRRFNWREMAVPHIWEPTQMAETSPVVSGRVYRSSSWEYRDLTANDHSLMASLTGIYNKDNPTTLMYYTLEEHDPFEEDIYKKYNQFYDKKGVANTLLMDFATAQQDQTEASEGEDPPITSHYDVPKDNTPQDYAAQDHQKDAKRKKRKDVVVHAELVSLDGRETRSTEQMSNNNRFRFLMPNFYGEAALFLSAADTTKWWSENMKKKKVKKYPWVQTKQNKDDLPIKHRNRYMTATADYKVLIDHPYPRFVKPYNYYQQHLLETADSLLGAELLADGTHQMKEVRIGARRGGQKGFSDSIPAFMVDADQAYNDAIDGGIYYPSPEMMVRNYLGDYGMDYPVSNVMDPETGKIIPYTGIQTRYGFDVTRRAIYNLTSNADSIYMRGNLASVKVFDKFGHRVFNMSDAELAKYYDPSRIDKYIIYTDYQPRLEGSSRYSGSNLPETAIAIYPFFDDSRRPVYRDRRIIFKGYAFHDDFYHPNYKNRKLDEAPKDYRRTLYWNPALQLDNAGHAEVELYNNGKHGQIDISAEGMTKDGTILGN